MRSLEIRDIKAKIPIIGGGMAVKISRARLAAAVANEGGIGLLAASGLEPEELIKEIRRARELTHGGFIGVNVMMAVRECEELSFAAINEGIDLLVVGAGFISKLLGKIIAKAHENNTPVAYIVSSVRATNLLSRGNLKIDAVIAEGCHAGGHLGTKESIREILPKIVSSVSVPVIAAGGCGTRDGFRDALELGASGVQIGTRLALSKECGLKGWQKVILAAGKEDILVLSDPGSPVGMPLRVVKTPVVERLIEDGVSHVQGIRTNCKKGCLSKCQYRDSKY